jgi:hypothetical protein
MKKYEAKLKYFLLVTLIFFFQAQILTLSLKSTNFTKPCLSVEFYDLSPSPWYSSGPIANYRFMSHLLRKYLLHFIQIFVLFPLTGIPIYRKVEIPFPIFYIYSLLTNHFKFDAFLLICLFLFFFLNVFLSLTYFKQCLFFYLY